MKKGKISQVYNKRIGAYVKMERQPNGMQKIVNVKEFQPKTPFKGVPKK